MIKKAVLSFSKLVEKPFKAGELIDGRYRIIEHLGCGSYGHSYLVHDSVASCQMVLKALRIHKRCTKAGRTGFEREKKLLESINHPGFPRYIGSGITGKVPYFTMEYITGNTFEQLIFKEGKTYGETEAFVLGNQLLGLIEHLHQQGIIHRDVRIPNVMMDGPHMKLIDVGLARMLNGKVDLSRDPVKPFFREITPQSDFYGLGHFLLFLLYSRFSPPGHGKEKSWEEELEISSKSKHVIKKLLQLEQPYETCKEIRRDFFEIITEGKGEEEGYVIF